MGFRDYINNIKKKAYDYKDKQEKNRAIRTANELKEIRKRRIAAEGRAKVFKLKEKEENKLKKAQETTKKNRPLYKLTQEIKSRKKKKSSFGKLPGQMGQGGGGGWKF